MATVYRIQTVDPVDGNRPRRLGMCGDPDRAELWRRTEEAATGTACEVVPIEVTSSVWAGLREDPETGAPLPSGIEGWHMGGRVDG